MLTPPDWERWGQLVDVPLPLWVPVRRTFPVTREADVAAAVRREMSKPEISRFLRPGKRVALGVGSRGLASLVEMVRTAVVVLYEHGCEPFIVPAMGSHGGATAEGQRDLLAHLGVTEVAVGAPVRSNMDGVEIGRLNNRLPIYFDREALSADLVVPINRIKPHTTFRGNLESGLTKMLAIGLGKHTGATAIHSMGWDLIEANMREALEIIKAQTPFRFGLASVENAYHQVALVEAVSADVMPRREEELLTTARDMMAQMPFTQVDVLVVGEIGKEISGTGMDPNITGRPPSGGQWGLQANKIVVLNLSSGSGGNAAGIGMADVTTERVISSMDLDRTWVNVLTSTNLPIARIPVFMPNDRMAIQLALKCCGQVDTKEARLAWIRNTLELDEMYLSEALWADIQGREGVESLGPAQPLRFDEAGNLRFD